MSYQQPQWSAQPQWGAAAPTATSSITTATPCAPASPSSSSSAAAAGESSAATAGPRAAPATPPSESDVPAEVLLQVMGVAVNEVINGVQRRVMDSAELIVLSLEPTEEELELACQNLGLASGSLKRRDGRPLIFALAGDYKVPITEAVPCVKEQPNSFIFAVPNLFVEIIFPPAGADDELDAFDMLVRNYGSLRDNSTGQRRVPLATPGAPLTNGAELALQQPQERKLSTKIAGGIGAASIFAVQGIRKGTELLTKGLHTGTQRVVQHTKPAEKPVTVSNEAREHVKQLRNVTKGAVMVSSGLAASLIGVTAVVGQGIGAQIAKRRPATQDPKYDGIKEVAGAAIGGVGMVFVTATDAARTLLTATCGGVSTIVTHKLGAEAGEVTTEGLGVVQDVVAVQQNMRQVGLKAIVKRTGSQAAERYTAEMDAQEKRNKELRGEE